MVRLILGSTSPARLGLLRDAGLHPVVVASQVDESRARSPEPSERVLELATMKGEAARSRLATVPELQFPPAVDTDQRVVLVAADTLLEMDGAAQGKPGSEENAIIRLYRMRGRQGVLHTGHWVSVWQAGEWHTQSRVVSTIVFFADMSDAEISAYAASGEPEQVAGSFTIDGLGSPFIAGIKGIDDRPADASNVIGLSLPTLRQMLTDLGVAWTDLWKN
jgi:septum formation protein